jgi:hypothetical protein
MRIFLQIFVAALILKFSLVFAQNSKSNFVLESELFMQKLDSTKLKSEKINLIKQKIKEDSIFEFSNSDRIIIRVDKNETIKEALERRVECKILFLINYKKSLKILDLYEFPELSNFVNALNDKVITEIETLNKKRAMELFGGQGNCGTLILKTDYKMLKNIAKKTKIRL